MRRRILYMLFILLLCGCSTSSSKLSKYDEMTITMAEKCDVNNVYVSYDLCSDYKERRDKIVEQQRQDEIKRKEELPWTYLRVFIIMLISAIMIVISIRIGKIRKRKMEEVKENPYLDPEKKPLEILGEIDAGFNIVFLKEGIQKLFVSIYEVINGGDEKNIEAYVSNTVLQQFMNNREGAQKKKVSYKFANLQICEFSIEGYEYLEGNEIIKILLSYKGSEIEKYDEKESASVVKVVLIKLQRPYKTQTPIGKIDFITNCKQCGGPVNPKHDRVCIYCGAGLPSHAFTWEMIQFTLQ